MLITHFPVEKVLAFHREAFYNVFNALESGSPYRLAYMQSYLSKINQKLTGQSGSIKMRLMEIIKTSSDKDEVYAAKIAIQSIR